MKIAYLGIDLLHPVLRSFLDGGCGILKIFTCQTDNVTEFNTEVIRTAKENGLPYTKKPITEKLDAGDILLQETFYVDSKETLVTYMDKVSALIPDMAERLLRDFPAL